MDWQSATEWQRWRESAAALLASNRVAVAGHRYTRPAPSTYEQQWLWDSCFHALAYRWCDLDMARDELRAVVAHQVVAGDDAGMIPHMAYWNGGGEALWAQADRSIITQPPLVGVAARAVYERARDRELLASLYPHLVAYHEWFDRRRDPDGDHLVSVIHPWEAGWDASPRWDQAMGIAENFSHETGRLARVALAARVREFGCDARALARAGSFCVEVMDFNAIRAADLEALAFSARELGKPNEAQRWQHHAEQIQTAMRAKMLAPFPHDLNGDDETPVLIESASEFVALFGGVPSPSQAQALVARLQMPAFWATFPVTTTPLDAATFAPDTYWRGNVWLSVNWLIYAGLRRYGFDAAARSLAEASLRLIDQSGFWEYYHPQTGKGLGAYPQSWSAIVLDMFAQEAAR